MSISCMIRGSYSKVEATPCLADAQKRPASRSKEELTMDGQLQLNGKVLTMDQTLEEQGVKELVGGKRV